MRLAASCGKFRTEVCGCSGDLLADLHARIALVYSHFCFPGECHVSGQPGFDLFSASTEVADFLPHVDAISGCCVKNEPASPASDAFDANDFRIRYFLVEKASATDCILAKDDPISP